MSGTPARPNGRPWLTVLCPSNGPTRTKPRLSDDHSNRPKPQLLESLVAENSKIEWTTHTFNPWIGCMKVSAGCDRCYAESLAKRYGWVEWGQRKTDATEASTGGRKRTS